ncbi:hypothetical protein ACFVFQ_37345 [Streptomyces sp. NPDC057743]|uniref:hypothetical protein n=1 Tax=Streptomyces sp. NPDC057743 TaxID=3346236 RepID=UPI003689B827
MTTPPALPEAPEPPTPPAVPDLDTLRFQDLVDTAKRLLPTRAPTWSDHNVSDPGITLIEYAAHLTDHLSYRCNTLPSETLRALLTLYGATPAMPLPARTHLTFTANPLGTDQASITLPEGTRVTTGDTNFITTAPVTLKNTTLTIGTGIPGYNGDDGPAHKAQLNTPTHAYLATDGNIYITDQNDPHNRRVDAIIRRVDTTGTITTHRQPLPPPSTPQPPIDLTPTYHQVIITYATHPAPVLAIQAIPTGEPR